ncbi:MAG: hypothetical protein RLZ98_2539 [Pseudomonadota bacterium]|jgi:CrcB protein
MRLLLLACAGGAIGAGLRFLVNTWFAARGLSAFPWATITVNVVGSALMGIMMGLLLTRFAGSPELRTFVATGILGGLTTFSAFSLDTVELWSNRPPADAILYVVASVVLSIGALALTLALTLWITRPVA